MTAAAQTSPRLKEITVEELLKLFDPSVHDSIRRIAAKPGVTDLVVFENLQMDSSRFGDRSAVIVGPGCTYKSLEEIAGLHLGDLPSQRKYPVAFARCGGTTT